MANFELAYESATSMRGYFDIPQNLSEYNVMLNFIPYTTVSLKFSGPPLLSKVNDKLSIKIKGSGFTATETITITGLWFWK